MPYGQPHGDVGADGPDGIVGCGNGHGGIICVGVWAHVGTAACVDESGRPSAWVATWGPESVDWSVPVCAGLPRLPCPLAGAPDFLLPPRAICRHRIWSTANCIGFYITPLDVIYIHNHFFNFF